MRHVKLTAIPPANRRRPPGGGRLSSQPLGRPVWRVIKQDVPVLASLVHAVERQVTWLQEQIATADDERERHFWEEALQRLLGG